MTRALRFGILGAARIAPPALVSPCQDYARAEVVAIAARDPQRARRFAQHNGVPEVSESYADLVQRPDIDAVYNALPASLHAPWTIAALRAGKHVLCEKPFALDAEEAQRMVDEADTARVVLVEAFHYRYHPLFERVIEICSSGKLGAIERIEGRFNAPIANPEDIRFDLALGGGATMDLGCYPIHWLRTLLKSEPEVVSAEAREGPEGVDIEMTAELRFRRQVGAGDSVTAPGGVSGIVRCEMHGEAGFLADLNVICAKGELEVINPLAPNHGHRIRLRKGADETTATVEGDTTFRHQLEAFTGAVLDGASVPTGGADAVANMRVIDAVYAAAGLPPRQGSA